MKLTTMATKLITRTQEMRAEVERLKDQARPDDGRSWWARNASGQQVCCRVIYMSQQSPRLGSIPNDDRMLRIIVCQVHA